MAGKNNKQQNSNSTKTNQKQDKQPKGKQSKVQNANKVVAKPSAKQPSKTPSQPKVQKQLRPAIPSTAGLNAALRTMGFGRENCKEVIFSITDYFDHDSTRGPTIIHGIRNTFSFIGNSGDQGQGSVIRKCTLYALPRAKNAAVWEQSFVSIASVPTTTAEGGIVEFGQQTSFVKPNFNINWVKLAEFNYLKIFKDSNILPYNYDGYRILFRYNLLNPDTGIPIVTDDVQMKMIVEMATPLQTTNTAPMLKTGGPPGGSPNAAQNVSSDQFVQVQIKHMADSR